ncbi:MAG: DUF2029 domain-containing protein [Anaerolineae bacterium]|nr:DUF2029 domain-containing protein [Anaerolineae bacterium]
MLARLYQPTYLREARSSSKVFRRILMIVAVFTLLRFTFQGMLLSGAFFSNEKDFLPPDLLVYIVAAGHFQQREPLYLQGPIERLEDIYQYAPSFALAFTPFLSMHPALVLAIHTVLHVLAYALLYMWWDRIFRRWGLEQARVMLVWTLPAWLVFSTFWADLLYLNLYIPMALLGTWLIEAVLEERLGWSVLWLSIILQIKPQWAFAALVPLLLGRWRFFLKLAVLAAMVYAAVVGVVILAAGPEYGWQQHVEYVEFLARLSRDFPWRDPDAPFLGYNHSITQIVFYLLGVSAGATTLAALIKGLLLAPLVIMGLRTLARPVNDRRLGLVWAFALYLGALIWLDMVWEVALGVAIFPYLLAVPVRRSVRVGVWVVFLSYALIDAVQILSFIVMGEGVLSGPYVLTDLSIYIPVVMIVVLVFYGLLLRRLGNPATAET